MDSTRFKQLVSTAVETLPEEFSTRLENVDVVVQDWPTSNQLRKAGLRRGESLLGLYEGVPLLRRGQHYGLVLPDKITLFQKPIEARCGQNETRIATEITIVVKHEIAHHFGLGEARLEQIEKERGW